MIHHPSPNWNERPAGSVIDTVILHYTGMISGSAALDRMCDPAAQVSAHYMIEEDGRIFHLVDEEKRAWHAGLSNWRGRDNLNHTSIGVELVNPGHEFGYRAFPGAQIDSLIILLSGIKKRHTIPASGFIGHSDIAPTRKTDPGELFPWKRLSEHGFGLWSSRDGSSTLPVAGLGQKGKDVIKFNKQLGIVGYHLDDIECFDATIQSIVRAFQAHWRSDTVSGLIDAGTASVLEDIADQMRH